MSLAVLEAMSTGLPAMGSKVLDYIVEDGRSGFIVAEGPDAQQIEEYRRLLLETSDATWEQLGKRGRQIVLERFTWDAIAGRVCQVYLEAVKSHRKGKG